MNKVKCKICGEMFTQIDVQKICLNCQKKICEALGLKIPDVNNWENVEPKEKEILSDLVYLISEMQGYIDYLLHAIDHHTHSTKTVEVVDVE